jgi:hypothetical protein
MTTEQRLERLERENRWMRRTGAVAVAVAAAVFLIGQGRDKELPDLEVRSLTVKGKDGFTRIRLSTFDGWPFLGLYDKDSRLRAMLASTGTDGMSGLSLFDPDRKRRARLATAADGSPLLSLHDKTGRSRAALGVATTVEKKTGAETKTAENTLTMYDAKGKVIWQAPR